ncbi:MAG: hypothetical protein ACOYXA_16145 [Bacteroidota bacterium]
MKKNLFVLSVLALVLGAFAPLGGDHLQLSVNGKKLIEQFGQPPKQAVNLVLDASLSAGSWSIYYNHCGQVGKGRQLLLRDTEHRLLAEWKYPDVADLAQSHMMLEGKELASRMNGRPLQLSYLCQEWKHERVLAILQPATVGRK